MIGQRSGLLGAVSEADGGWQCVREKAGTLYDARTNVILLLEADVRLISDTHPGREKGGGKRECRGG